MYCVVPHRSSEQLARELQNRVCATFDTLDALLACGTTPPGTHPGSRARGILTRHVVAPHSSPRSRHSSILRRLAGSQACGERHPVACFQPMNSSTPQHAVAVTVATTTTWSVCQHRSHPHSHRGCCSAAADGGPRLPQRDHRDRARQWTMPLAAAVAVTEAGCTCCWAATWGGR